MSQVPSKDYFLSTSLSPPSTSTPPRILFFIPGNPGLISYYHSFLALLSSDTALLNHGIHTIAGFSHGGFEIDHSIKQDQETTTSLQYPPGSPTGPLFSLSDQVELTFLRIAAVAESTHATPSVVLVGHSVGAYIALEVVRKWHEKYSVRPHAWPPPCSIETAILLTPTISDIAKSPSGQKMTTLTTYIPYLSQIAQTATIGLRMFLPKGWLRCLVQNVTGMRDPGLEATVAWLSSARGVQQALEMGRNEMREITGDRWGEEVWGAAAAANVVEGRPRPPNLIFYFADSDHWVGKATREELVKARGRGDGDRGGDAWKAEMFVEKTGELSHSWCLTDRESKLVAVKVSEWIRETVVENKSNT